MNNNYSIEHIENLRIHELRDFARKVGVSSPTTLKKEELIEKISALINESDNINNASKHIVNQDELDFYSLLTLDNSDLLNDLVKDSNNLNAEQNSELKNNTMIMRTKENLNSNDIYSYPMNEYVGFNFKINQNECNYSDGSPEEKEGYLDIHPNGYGIVRANGFLPSENDVYLTQALIKKYDLKKGYRVRGKVKKILCNKPKIMYEILSSDCKVEKPNKTLNFEDMPYNSIGDKFYLEKFNYKLRKGERVYFSNLNIEDVIALGTDLIDENGVNVKIVNIKSKPEEKFSTGDKLEMINCQFNKTEIEIINAIELVVERLKREFETKKSSVLIIYNFSELIRIYNVAVDGFYDFNKFSAKALNKLSNLLFTAKNLDSKVNLTILCIDKDGIAKDVENIINIELKDMFNKIY